MKNRLFKKRKPAFYYLKFMFQLKASYFKLSPDRKLCSLLRFTVFWPLFNYCCLHLIDSIWVFMLHCLWWYWRVLFNRVLSDLNNTYDVTFSGNPFLGGFRLASAEVPFSVQKSIIHCSWETEFSDILNPMIFSLSADLRSLFQWWSWSGTYNTYNSYNTI